MPCSSSGFAISEHFYGEGHGHRLDLLSVSILIGQILGFTLVTWFASTKLLPKVIVLLHRFLQVPQLSFGLLLGGLFLVVVGAEEVGLHGSLGALLFGAALSDAALPGATRHYAWNEKHGRRIFRPTVFRISGPAPEL